MGNAIFRKDFIQFVQHYPSTSVSYMTDSTILVWRLTAAAFPIAVAAVWQKNSPLLYCLDVLRDQQKKFIHAISIPEPYWLLKTVQKHKRSGRSGKFIRSGRLKMSIRTKSSERCSGSAWMYLQPHYGNWLFGNVYLSATRALRGKHCLHPIAIMGDVDTFELWCLEDLGVLKGPH